MEFVINFSHFSDKCVSDYMYLHEGNPVFAYSTDCYSGGDFVLFVSSSAAMVCD